MIELNFKIFSIILLIIFKFNFCKSSNSEVLDQFGSYKEIKIKYFNSINSEIIKNDFIQENCNQINLIHIIFLNSTIIKLKVNLNNNFLSKNYNEHYQLNGSKIINKENSHDCFFNGYVVDQKLDKKLIRNSSLVLNLFRNELNGFFRFNEQLYFIHFDEKLKKYYLLNSNNLKNSNFKCGFSNSENLSFKNQFYQHKIKKRNTQKVIGAYQQTFETRFVELVIVNDHSLFLRYRKDKEKLINRSKQIASVVNSLYNQLNIFVVLVGVEVWTEEDEIEISKDGNITLSRFLKYRKQKLLPRLYNDNAQLITNTSFLDSVVGKALKGPICTEEYSGGVNSDHNELVGIVATTVAHELGHNFGLEHDLDNCTCTEKKCIMNPSSGVLTPKFWSDCSTENLKEIFKHGIDTCLQNLPSESFSYECGNGILESNEECDCGTEFNCLKKNNTCCDFRTCKLKPQAKCATGICCDLNTCNFFKSESHVICRSAKGFCDLPEYCNGNSEFCPKDIYVHNGVKCEVNGEESFCANGKCSTHKSQCQLLFGSKAEVAIDRCYQENANNASKAANCGFDYNLYGEKVYKPCKKKDVYCGRLHCLHKNKLEYGLESAATQSIISRNNTIICQTAIIDLGLKIPDPGLVRNGAKCGEDKMCFNQECISVPKTFCKYNCNDHGICNNLNECHCFDGYYPPYCYRMSLKLRIFLFLFFIFFIITTIYIIYIQRESIQTWWIVKRRTAEIKKRAKSNTFKLDKAKLNLRNQNTNINFDLKNLEISSPIPIDNETNTKIVKNNSAYENITDNPNSTTNENLNRLWDASDNQLRPELLNKFVKPALVPKPIRKAPLPPGQTNV